MWAPVLQKLQRETQHTPVSPRAAITSTVVHYISAAVGFRLTFQTHERTTTGSMAMCPSGANADAFPDECGQGQHMGSQHRRAWDHPGAEDEKP